MKAIIEIVPQGVGADPALEVARQFDAGQAVEETDYRLNFASARLLFSHLTRMRLELLDQLRRIGACSVDTLAKTAGRNHSNVIQDVDALERLGLIKRDASGVVLVPFDAVGIRLGLAQAA